MSDLKSMESQLSLEKKIIKKSFLDQFLSKSEKGPSKHTENRDSGERTRKNSKINLIASLISICNLKIDLLFTMSYL